MQPAAAESPSKARSGARLARRVAWAFGVVAILLVIFLVATGTDWRDAMKSVLARGGRLRAAHYGHWGVWWGCAIDAVICVVLAFTSRWWAAAPAEKRGPATASVPGMTRNGWLALLGLLAVAGALRWERAGLSFYNDEAHTFRRYIGGQHLRHDDGTVEWRQVTWTETVWLNKVGNNSMPCSILGRLSYDAWRKLSHAADGALGEHAVRLPVILASIAGLIVLWMLVRRLWPASSACWWGLALAALHPWHVRYSSEGRGHGYLLLAVPCCFYFLQRALEDDRWRWWMGMGLAQFLCVWSFPGAGSFLVGFNGLLLVLMYWQGRGHRDIWRSLARPLVAMVVGAMITLPVMLPNVEQLREAVKVLGSLKGQMNFGWWEDVLGVALGGVGWVDHDTANPENLVLSRMVASHAWTWLMLLAPLLPLGCGVWPTLRQGITGGLAVFAGPLAAAGMWVLMWHEGKVLYLWYVIFMLPGLLIVWAAGADALASRATSWAARLAAGAVLVLPLVDFAWTDSLLVTHGKENLRGLASAVPDSALHGTMFSDVDLYDPDVIMLHNVADLDALVQQARAGKRALYVSFSRRNEDPLFKEFYRRVKDEATFEKVAIFPGQEDPQFTHYLHRLKE